MTRRTFLALWAVVALFKLAVATSLPLFGDEAFYWWESRHLAWSYSDLPPMTAWLIALATMVPGSELAVRWPFLLMGLLLPWQIVWLSRYAYGDAVAWRAGMLALVLPLAFAMGVLALPDVPMAALSLVAAHLLLNVLSERRPVAWLLLGAVLGLGMLSHYRFAAVPWAVAAVVLMHASGRQALRTPWPWLAALIASLSLLPLWLFNAGHDYAGLRFQLLDRHPWAWQSDGWLQLAEQALVVGPVLMLLFAWAVGRAWRQRPLTSPDRVLMPMAAGVWLLFFVLGFFADNDRFRWHWSLPAYLILLPVLAAHWTRVSLRIRALALATSGAIIAVVLAYFAAGIWPQWGGAGFDGKRFPSNFSGWREVAAWQGERSRNGTDPVVVDNFMLAAALTFYMQLDRPDALRVLDDPLNRHHGRAVQLSIWAVDEVALASAAPAPGWLLVEETARRFSDRWAWYQGVCARFANLRLDGVLDLFGGRKRFVRWRHDGYVAQADCRQPEALPPLGWIEDGPSHWRRGEPVSIAGWVVQAGLGIDSLQMWVDDELVATVPRTQPAGWPWQLWGDLDDPAGENVGFRFVLDTREWTAGRHRYRVLAQRPDGLTWPIHEGDIELRP